MRRVSERETERLPCEVRIADGPTFGIGVDLSTLLGAINDPSRAGAKFTRRKKKVVGWVNVNAVLGRAGCLGDPMFLLGEQEPGAGYKSPYVPLYAEGCLFYPDFCRRDCDLCRASL